MVDIPRTNGANPRRLYHNTRAQDGAVKSNVFHWERPMTGANLQHGGIAEIRPRYAAMVSIALLSIGLITGCEDDSQPAPPTASTPPAPPRVDEENEVLRQKCLKGQPILLSVERTPEILEGVGIWETRRLNRELAGRIESGAVIDWGTEIEARQVPGLSLDWNELPERFRRAWLEHINEDLSIQIHGISADSIKARDEFTRKIAELVIGTKPSIVIVDDQYLEVFNYWWEELGLLLRASEGNLFEIGMFRRWEAPIFGIRVGDRISAIQNELRTPTEEEIVERNLKPETFLIEGQSANWTIQHASLPGVPFEDKTVVVSSIRFFDEARFEKAIDSSGF